MDWAAILQYVAIAVAVASVAGVRIQHETINLLKENNSALNERIIVLESETKECLTNHQQNEKKLVELQAELTAYKELTLVPKELITELISYDKAILAKLDKQ